MFYVVPVDIGVHDVLTGEENGERAWGLLRPNTLNFLRYMSADLFLP